MSRDFKGIWIPKEIWLDKNLSMSEKFLLLEIDSFATNGECFATNAYFAEFLGLSKDRVSKLISSLKAKGYIEVSFRYKQGTKEVEKRVITTMGYKEKTCFSLLESDDRPMVVDDDTPSVKTTIPLVDSDHTPLVENNEDINTKTFTNTYKKNTKKKKTAPLLHGKGSEEIKRDFETFWSAYPKKRAKPVALRAFEKIAPDDGLLQEILDALERHKQSKDWKRDNGQYIPHPSTWLNQHRWEDEIDGTGKREFTVLESGAIQL